MNFATGYVITELAKPRKSAGKEEEEEREKEVTWEGMGETGALKEPGQME